MEVFGSITVDLSMFPTLNYKPLLKIGREGIIICVLQLVLFMEKIASHLWNHSLMMHYIVFLKVHFQFCFVIWFLVSYQLPEYFLFCTILQNFQCLTETQKPSKLRVSLILTISNVKMKSFWYTDRNSFPPLVMKNESLLTLIISMTPIHYFSWIIRSKFII